MALPNGSPVSSHQSPAGSATDTRTGGDTRGEMAAILRDVLLPPAPTDKTDVNPPAPDEQSAGTTGEEPNSAAGDDASGGHDPSQSEPTTDASEADEDGEDDAKAEDDGSKSLTKRLERLEAQKQELQTKLAERKALREELEAVDEAVAKASATVDGCQTLDDLERCYTTAQTTEGVLEKMLRRASRDGAEEITVQQAAAAAGEPEEIWVKQYGPDKRWSVDELESRLDAVRTDIRSGIPERAKFLQARQAHQRTAQEQFGYLKDKADPLHAAAQAARRQFPALNRLPHADVVIGYTLMGEALVKAALEGKLEPHVLSAMRKHGGFTGKANVAPAPKPKPRPVPTPTPTPAPGGGDKWAPIGKDPGASRSALRDILSG